MFSFVRKINPFRRDSVRIQNELSRMKIVATISQPFHSAQQCHCSEIPINNNGEKKPGNNVVDSAQRKGINKLLKEFEKENIKVATLMDQDGRIFFSIEMTDIVRNDEELKKIAKVVQESIKDSSGLLMSTKEGDEVYRKLKKHFLFQSVKNVTPDKTIQGSHPHSSSRSTKSTYVSIRNSNPSGPSKGSSEKTMVDVKPSSAKLFTISGDETELNTLLYSFIISKLERQNNIKSRQRKKILDLPIDTVPYFEIDNVRVPKKQETSATKNILIKLTKQEGRSQTIQRKENKLTLAAEIIKCKPKQKAKGTKKAKTDPCTSLQLLKKQLERKLRRKLLSKENRSNKNTRDKQRKQEQTDHVLKKHKHHKDKRRGRVHEKHDRSKNRPKTTDDTNHCKLSSGDIEGNYIQHEMRVKEYIPTQRFKRRNGSEKADIKLVPQFIYSSSQSKEKSKDTITNFNESDIDSEELTRRRVLEFDDIDPSEKLIAITTFE